MAFKRSDRVGNVIRKEISLILLDDIKDTGIGFVTITRVKMSDDLRRAIVYYSNLGGEDERKRVKEGLERAKGYMRKTLGQRLRIRYIPELTFQFDDSLEYGNRIESLITELKERDSG